MKNPTLEEIKIHCRIDNDYEDSLLETYRLASIKQAENYLNRTLKESASELQENELLLTEDIKVAILLLTCHFYHNREIGSVPLGFKALLDPYRHMPL